MACEGVWEESWENQRYYPLVGWSTNLLKTDRFNFSSACGKEERKREDIKLKSEWIWEGGWFTNYMEGHDTDGWTYAFDFPDTFKWGLPKSSSLVRRRLWRRLRVRDPEIAIAEASGRLEPCESFLEAYAAPSSASNKYLAWPTNSAETTPTASPNASDISTTEASLPLSQGRGKASRKAEEENEPCPEWKQKFLKSLREEYALVSKLVEESDQYYDYGVVTLCVHCQETFEEVIELSCSHQLCIDCVNSEILNQSDYNSRNLSFDCEVFKLLGLMLLCPECSRPAFFTHRVQISGLAEEENPEAEEGAPSDQGPAGDPEEGQELAKVAKGATSKLVVDLVRSNKFIYRIEEAWENERRLMATFCHTNLLPTDRPHFSTKDGAPLPEDQTERFPEEGWRWLSDWRIDYAHGDQQGWRYIFNWTNSTDDDLWAIHAQANHWVRRRRVFRVRVCLRSNLREIVKKGYERTLRSARASQVAQRLNKQVVKEKKAASVGRMSFRIQNGGSNGSSKNSLGARSSTNPDNIRAHSDSQESFYGEKIPDLDNA